VTEIYKIPLGEDALQNMPKSERTLLLVLGHLANEINILTKTFYWAAHTDDGSDVQRLGSNAQAMLFGRILCGKLYEGWRLIGSAYYGSKLSKTYDPLLDAETKDALKEAKRYFGKENAIGKIRNGFAFHFSPEEINDCFENSERADPMDMYMSDDNANTLYSFAETVVNQSSLESINKDDPQAALAAMIDESTRITALFNQIIGGCMSTAIRRHLGENLEELGAESIDLPDLLDFHDIRLPYFVSVRETKASH